MLVLSRKNGQKIIINDNIEITILESRFDSCKIAINAPRDVKIFREEVYKQIQFTNKMSNKTSLEVVEKVEEQNPLLNPDLAGLQKLNKIVFKKNND